MNKLLNVLLIIIAVFLIFNGLINIVDNGRILAYDITTILSGLGFVLITFIVNKKK